MKKLFLKPVRNLKVRMEPPSDRFLPEDGKLVKYTPWWARKLREGDVVIAEETPTPTQEG